METIFLFFSFSIDLKCQWDCFNLLSPPLLRYTAIDRFTYSTASAIHVILSADMFSLFNRNDPLHVLVYNLL